MSHTPVFSSASILLPKAKTAADWQKWAVIACDQFTSQMDYWNDCVQLIDGAPSAYDYILPEAYLDTDKEAAHAAAIADHMQHFDPAAMDTFDGIVYVERTLPDGSVRHGMIGKIDLEAYSYAADSTSPIRATEATILSRIPPRQKIRAEAAIELPHILILMDDTGSIFPWLCENRGDCTPLYDFDLMLGGGHVTGWGVSGAALDTLNGKLAAYEEAGAGGVLYAMGDGNHSLAAAKAHYEAIKKALGAEKAASHPARYALCEITALGEDSLVFEPIYRLLLHADTKDVVEALSKVTAPGEGEQSFTLCVGETAERRHFVTTTHALTVGTLQNWIDDYTSTHPAVVCDYIHGEADLRALAKEEDRVGFVFDTIAKSELFAYIAAHGTTPRKTFSMGEARSKRYYLEGRAIR